MTTCIGVFIVPTGFRFDKPRPGNPRRAWAAADYRGIRGFISTAGKFFKNNHLDYLDQLDHQGHQGKYFQRPRKTLKTPKTPFCYQTGRDRLLPRSGQEILMGSIKRGLWIGQGETIRLNVCYYR
jgi:hypothetical protein